MREPAHQGSDPSPSDTSPGERRRVAFIAHCLLNQNAKVDEGAKCPAMWTPVIHLLRERGYVIRQMPCPELAYGGARRFWGVREQFERRCTADIAGAWPSFVAAVMGNTSARVTMSFSSGSTRVRRWGWTSRHRPPTGAGVPTGSRTIRSSSRRRDLPRAAEGRARRARPTDSALDGDPSLAPELRSRGGAPPARGAPRVAHARRSPLLPGRRRPRLAPRVAPAAARGRAVGRHPAPAGRPRRRDGRRVARTGSRARRRVPTERLRGRSCRRSW